MEKPALNVTTSEGLPGRKRSAAGSLPRRPWHTRKQGSQLSSPFPEKITPLMLQGWGRNHPHLGNQAM